MSQTVEFACLARLQSIFWECLAIASFVSSQIESGQQTELLTHAAHSLEKGTEHMGLTLSLAHATIAQVSRVQHTAKSVSREASCSLELPQAHTVAVTRRTCVLAHCRWRTCVSPTRVSSYNSSTVGTPRCQHLALALSRHRHTETSLSKWNTSRSGLLVWWWCCRACHRDVVVKMVGMDQQYFTHRLKMACVK